MKNFKKRRRFKNWVNMELLRWLHQSDTTLPSSEKARKNIFEFQYKSEKFSHNYSQEVVSASGWKFPRTKSSNSVSCIQQETTAEAIESALDVHLATDNLATGHRKGNVYRKNKNIFFSKETREGNFQWEFE